MCYAKLKGKITEVFETRKNFAEAMGKDVSTISAKLNNKTPWTHEEIEKACVLLSIPIEEVYVYFFAKKTGKSQL